MSSVDASVTPRSAPRVVSAHQVRVDSLEPGLTTREMISARARSRWRPAGPSSAGSPSLAAMACTAATWPCGSDPVMVTASAAATLLVDITGLVDSDYVDFPAVSRHSHILRRGCAVALLRHTEYSDYTLRPGTTETAAQGAAPTESYGNFGLMEPA